MKTGKNAGKNGMAKTVNILNARQVATLTKPGRYADGGNLFLSVRESGSRSWVFRSKSGGVVTERGIGSFDSVPLVKAREIAKAMREAVANGRDPRTVLARDGGVPTFGELSDKHIEAMAGSWRNEKHRAQWVMTMREYCKPLRKMPVDQIQTADVLRVLKPLWQKVPETASRLRGRIEVILAAASAHGYRDGINPAQWRNHLDKLLPARGKLTRGHQKALPFSEVPAFMASLREKAGITPLALEFAILTAARSGEVRGATWAEIDFDGGIWSIPANRMKAARPHEVALSEPALGILKRIYAARTGDLIFPGGRGKPLSDATFTMLIKRMGHDVTQHGFRASFSTWCREQTAFPRELVEHALAHVVGDAVERAYSRGTALERRREVMAAWAAYCDGGKGADIIPLRKASGGD